MFAFLEIKGESNRKVLYLNQKLLIKVMSETEESAKAVTETVKLGTTLVEASERMGGFLSRILDEPITEAVGMFGDKLKFMRWKRKLRIVDEVNRILDERGVKSTRPIPPKLAIPILEQASLEENDELQDIWCNLIANSLDPNFKMEIRYSFIEIIKNLTTLDARILKHVYETTTEINNQNKTTRFIPYPIDFYQIAERVQASYIETELSLNNLQRVQCLWDNDIKDLHAKVDLYKIVSDEPHSVEALCLREKNFSASLLKDYFPDIKEVLTVKHSRFKLTPLGVAFIKACMK